MTGNGAEFSECRRYRYKLWRVFGGDDGRTCAFVMLNPSTADADYDDPTIRRCSYFSQRHECSTLMVVNLFAWRATNPKELEEESSFGNDIVGPENDRYLQDEIRRSDLTIVGWGAYHSLRTRDLVVHRIALNLNKQLHCLGRTKAGHPRHPLYIRKDTPLEPWTYTAP